MRQSGCHAGPSPPMHLLSGASQQGDVTVSGLAVADICSPYASFPRLNEWGWAIEVSTYPSQAEHS